MARGRKDEMSMRGHGDLGFVGERERAVDTYKGKEGGCVDRMLTSDCVPSFVETVKYSMKGGSPEGISRGDMPKGKGAKMSGPEFGNVHAKDASKGREATSHMKKGGSAKKMAMGGIGKERKGQY